MLRRAALLAALIGLAGGCARRTPAAQPVAEDKEAPQPGQPLPLVSIGWDHHDTRGWYLDYPRPKHYYDEQTFTVTLTRDGELRWHGVRVVRVLGDRRVQLDAAEVERLFDEAAVLAGIARGEPDDPRWCGRWPIIDRFTLELTPAEPELQVGLCSPRPTFAALSAIRRRLGALVEAEGWIDRHYLRCRIVPSRRYRFDTATGSIERRGLLNDVADPLKRDHRLRIILHTASSRRDPPGAARARAEAARAELQEIGVDPRAVEIIDIGTDLAVHAADDARASADEWIHFDVVDWTCLHPVGPVPPPPDTPWWR